ncbi:hypothetical protein [Streptomyces sp. NPDC059247]|uniref:hypothetical protein n=1 Tax=Streptomyces sp. NPDC059247 TaxID=3346790 RepID=UPI0036ACC64C
MDGWLQDGQKRALIGPGWNVYDGVGAVGDANRDGRPDPLAFGPRGNRPYRSTGDGKAPFRTAEVAGLAYVSAPGQPIG